MKKIGIAVMILAVIGVAVAAGVFVTGHPETTKVEQKHEKIKKEGKAYAGKYRMNILLDTNNKVLSGTVRATLKNATDDDLKRICVRNWAAAILQEKGDGGSVWKKYRVQNRDNLGKNRRTYFAD